ncbi:RNA ligase [Staphylococcus phage Koomba-kaat_1]|nr:RNA ligase [Staphylococcus phage Koomba-kaat_1]
MRQLILMRGAPGSGKTTYIKENGLEGYSLSPDILRTQYSAPVYDTEGNLRISQEEDHKVWDLLFSILEKRMENGEFTVIDATHSTAKLIKKYEKLSNKYGYRVYVVNIEVELDTLLERNNNRQEVKKVPVNVIENIYERLKHENIPSFAKEVDKNDLLNTIKWDKNLMNTDSYEKIHVIGDVHSCFTALHSLFPADYIIDNQNELFIFVGDYFDRGLESKQMFEYLEIIYKLKNVILLEGNHERHLRKYTQLEKEEYDNLCFAYNSAENSKEYFYKQALKIFHSRGFIPTLTSFIENGINQNRVKSILRKLQQVAYFSFKGQDYIVSHGGVLPEVLDNLNKISTSQLINGIGGYDFNVDDQWEHSNTIQIHGHRNLYREPLDTTKNSVNLEGRVEKGGCLRAITINKNNNIEKHEIKNTIYDPKFLLSNRRNDGIDKDLTPNQYLDIARKENKTIKTSQQYRDVFSVNFTKRAFSKKKWNQLTVSSRGIYIDEGRNTVLGRGYNKFFNINEVEETKLENMPDTIQFPLTGYKKENGFLGLMFYDPLEGIVYASKSKTHLSRHGNKYALLFKELVEKTLTKRQIQILATFLENHYIADDSFTLVFEVVDIEEDPHIIKYQESGIFLLDIISNTLSMEKKDYDYLKYVADEVGLQLKEKELKFASWEEFYKWYKDNNGSYNILHEGYVFEDLKGFMFKYKSDYYKDWKYMRDIAYSLSQRRDVRPKQYILTRNPELRDFYYWAKMKDSDELDKDIITLRDEFEKEKEK